MLRTTCAKEVGFFFSGKRDIQSMLQRIAPIISISSNLAITRKKNVTRIGIEYISSCQIIVLSTLKVIPKLHCVGNRHQEGDCFSEHFCHLHSFFSPPSLAFFLFFLWLIFFSFLYSFLFLFVFICWRFQFLPLFYFLLYVLFICKLLVSWIPSPTIFDNNRLHPYPTHPHQYCEPPQENRHGVEKLK